MTAKPKWQVYGVYVLIIILNISVSLAGVQKLTGSQHWIDQFQEFGYPVWFMYLIGALQVVGGVLLWIPKTRLVAAVLYMGIMAGAAFFNLMVGNTGIFVPNGVPILITGVVAWISRDSWPLSQFFASES